jgi:hypothetical protein
MNQSKKQPGTPVGPLTPSQEQAACLLQAFAALYFAGGTNYGLTPRYNPLLVGPSGVGKTHLVQALGRELNLPVLKLTVGDWLPHGVKHEAPTLHRLGQAVEQHERLIVLLDELDKFRSMEGTWALSVLTEVFTVLDRNPGGAWSPENIERLRRNVFLVGAGTWQDLWEVGDAKAPLGFWPSQAPGDGPAVRDRIMQKIRRARLIPPELLNRMHDRWLILEPYTAADFRAVARHLGLKEGILDPEAAAASGLNFRACENAVAAHALRAHLAKQQSPSPQPEEPTHENPPD